MDANSIRVLCIEESSEPVGAAKRLIQGNGMHFEVECVDRLVGGLGRLRAGGVDAVVLDLQLPDSEGLETLIALQAAAPNVPVVALTPTRDPLLALEVVRQGAFSCLTKGEASHPVLARAIRYAIERRDERRRMVQARRLEHRFAYVDDLTGLPNTHAFQERLQEIMARTRDEAPLALLVVDVEGLDAINDLYGYSVGDRVVRVAAARLGSCFPHGPGVARLGGAQFTVILENVAGPEDLIQAAESILEALSTPIIVDKHKIATKVSIGISFYPGDAPDVEALLNGAEMAMRSAKAEGGQGYQFYSRSKITTRCEQPELQEGLRQAINDHQISMDYQLQYDLQSHRITGLEALVRWDHPDLGRMPADRFLSLAKNTGLITGLGNRALRQACTDAARWKRMGLGTLPLGVNIAGRQLRQANVPQLLSRVLEETGLDSKDLVLELDEADLVEEVPVAALEALRERGVHLAIDKLGRNFAALGQLKHLPIDVMKISKWLVEGMARDERDMALTAALLVLADRLGLEVIAMGVETSQQAELLRSLGCRVGQGYHFGPPMPASEVEALLARDSHSPSGHPGRSR